MSQSQCTPLPPVSSVLTIIVVIIVAVGAFVLISTKLIGNLLDQKIGDIRVNVPKIRVKPPNVVIKMNQPDSSTPTISEQKLKSSKPPKLGHPNALQLHEPFLSVKFDEKPGKPPTKPKEDIEEELSRAIVVDTATPPTQPRIAVGCTTDADCNVVNGNGKNVCKSDGTCSCVGGGSGLFCHYGPTNYRDPKDMNEEERRRFKSKYRANMTLQDYKNWLMLYKDNIGALRARHRKNLRILLQGGQITARDVPAIQIRAPTDAADYFKRMYKGGNISVTFPEEGPYVAANYGQFDSFEPPENASSQWITGGVNAYTDNKDNARAVDWYMRPPVTVGEDEQRPGDVYQKYVERHHNLADIRALHNGAPVNNPRAIDLATFPSDDITVNFDL